MTKRKSAHPKKETDLKVRQIVFSALLEALNDIIGPDGKESIIRFASLSKEYSNTYLRPSLVNSLPKRDLIKLNAAMNRLLGFGTKAILKETGRKFAIFLAPYGYKLEEIAQKLGKWIEGDWNIEIKRSNGAISVIITNDPLTGSHVWTGFFETAATSSSPDGTRYVATNVLENFGDGSVITFELKQQDKERGVGP